MKKAFALILLLALVGTGGYVYWQRSASAGVSFRTTPVKRGDLLITISATGTVEPIEVVDVGAQVAGRIESFGTDPSDPTKTIDYGTGVDVGTVLARIDDTMYAADVAQATAQVEQAHANVRRAQADIGQMDAKLLQAQNNWKRAQELGPSRALAATEYDSYEAAYLTAKATVAVGKATLDQAEKGVLQAEASLTRVRTNLGYCTIRSPVKGVIIDRRVNMGQTVVASLNAPSLFLIAKDLKKMQVWVAVNEADIGSIQPRQAVTFTVDAFPGRVFRGEVAKIRLNASMTQNVVTYTVEINTDNSDGKLLPYLTANVRFEVAERKNVVVVPNVALRWSPEPQLISPKARRTNTSRERRPAAAGTDAASRPAHAPAESRGTVWVIDEGLVRPVEVGVGMTDGATTEIVSDTLTEGTEVVVGETEEHTDGSATNPFMPKLFGGRRSGG